VRTGPAEEPVAPRLVTEDHKVFAKEPHRLYRTVAAEFVD